MRYMTLAACALLLLSACQVPSQQPTPNAQSGIYGSVGASAGVSSGLSEKHQTIGVGGTL